MFLIIIFLSFIKSFYISYKRLFQDILPFFGYYFERNIFFTVFYINCVTEQLLILCIIYTHISELLLLFYYLYFIFKIIILFPFFFLIEIHLTEEQYSFYLFLSNSVSGFITLSRKILNTIKSMVGHWVLLLPCHPHL